jgi:vitamin B12 transporter
VNSLAILAFSFFFQVRLNQEIVVTASAVPETVESTPASVTVITRKDIERREERDVASVLREVPGLTVSQTGSLGKTASVFVRGASSKQVLVLWNGIEINDPYFSGYNWGQFSTAGVERVEVARGPFSSLYGADAVGGVVNIITTGGSDRFDVDLAAGGHGLRNGALSIARTSRPASYYATAETRQDEGFARNDNTVQKTVIAGVSHAAGTSTLGLTARFMNYNLGVPFNANSSYTAFVPTLHHRENGTEWQVAVPASAVLAGVHFDARASQSRRDDHNEDPDAGSFGRTRSMRRNGRVSARIATALGTIVAGVEAERSEAKNRDSFGLDLDNHRSSSNALFVEDRFDRQFGAARLDVSIGARRDRYTTFGSETSPRVAAAWSVNGNKFRAAYGEAFRAPQIGELYLPFFGNPDLKAERSRSFEAGYDRYFANDANVSVTLFDNRFRELITYDLSAFRFGNIGEAHTRGVEFSAATRRGPWSANANYTFMRATEEPSGEALLRRPKHAGAAGIGYQGGSAGVQLVVTRMGSRADVTDLSPFGSVTSPSYTKADVTFRWNAGAFTPYVRVENLTNERYAEVFGYPSPGRRALAGIRYASR